MTDQQIYDKICILLQTAIMTYGPDMCPALLGCQHSDLLLAVQNQDLSQAFALCGKPYAASTNPDTPYVRQAEIVEALCAAAARVLNMQAIELTDKLLASRRSERLNQVKNGLKSGDIARAKQFLGIYTGFNPVSHRNEYGFRYNPMTHYIECGWEPSEFFTLLADEFDPDGRQLLTELAWCVVRMPDGL